MGLAATIAAFEYQPTLWILGKILGLLVGSSEELRTLAKKAEIIIANKIDLDPDGKAVKDLKKKLNKTIIPISAVTGERIKELSELLWQKVKETKKEKKLDID